MILSRRARRTLASFSLLLVVPLPSPAQGLPDTEIWLAELGSDGLAGRPVRITGADGYHNQPHFSADSRYLYYSAEAENGQTDIRYYEPDGAGQKVISDSPLSDFSPTPIPGQNAISVVRVEADSRQRLWRIDLDTAKESVLFESVEPVGYHAWLSGDSVALFVLGETFDLHLASTEHDESTRVFVNIGRTLRVNRHTGKLYFVNKNVKPWEIGSFDPVTRSVSSVMSLFPLVEDFELDGRERFWSGNGSKLYVSEMQYGHWMLVADLSEYGINHITRLGASPDGRWLAIVSSP